MPQSTEIRDRLIRFTTAWATNPATRYDERIVKVDDVVGEPVELHSSTLLDAAELLDRYAAVDAAAARYQRLAEQLSDAVVKLVAENVAALHHGGQFDAGDAGWTCGCGEYLPLLDGERIWTDDGSPTLARHVRVKTVEKMREVGLDPRGEPTRGLFVEQLADGSVIEHRAEVVGHVDCGWEKVIWPDQSAAALEAHLATCGSAER